MSSSVHPLVFISAVSAVMAAAIGLRYFTPALMTGRLCRTIAAWCIFLVVWEWSIYAGIFRSMLLAAPTAVIDKALFHLGRGYLQLHTAATLGRFLAGFAIAVAVAVPLGIALGMFEKAYEWAAPLLNFIRMIPPPALLPFAILLLGIGERPGILVISLGCFFPILINTVQGVRSTEKIHIEVVRTNGGNRAGVLMHAMIPSALPTVLTGIRIGFGIGWLVLVSSEIVAADNGLGFMIEGGRNRLETPTIFVGMTVICGLGLAMDFFLKRAERFFVLRNGGGYLNYREV